VVSALLFAAPLRAQQAAAPATPDAGEEDKDLVVLSPFEVSASAESGYTAATTLAGNRLNTELRDIGNAVTVVTAQFLKDIGAKNNESLLQYTTNTEVGNYYGNFSGANASGAFLDESSRFTNPNTNTRVRGLAAADNAREYFVTDIPWDGYNVDGVDLQRGANSIIFGQGSPAGVINIRTKPASFRDSAQVTGTIGSFGTARTNVDINKVLVKDQLAVRLAAVYNDQQFKQEPAYELGKRVYGALRYEPAFLKKEGNRTILKASFEAGRVDSNRPRSIAPIDHITPWFYTGSYSAKNISGNTWTYQNLNRQTFNPITVQSSGYPGWGQAIQTLGEHSPLGANGSFNPEYQPWLGNFGQQFGGVLNYFDSKSTTPMGSWQAEPKSPYGIGTSGQIDKGTGIPYQRPVGIAGYASWAYNTRQDFYNFGLYKDKSLTDSSIFDFYNQLMDGPNKKEWQRFHTYNISLAQTVFHDQAGFEFVYNSENWKGGQLSLLSGDRQSLNVDINAIYSNGTNDAGETGLPFSNGTPNPNVGRPFVSDSGQFGNNETTSKKHSMRLTGFVTHDFARDSFGPDWLRRALGSHTVTALYARDVDKRDNRSWQRYATMDANYENLLNGTSSNRYDYTANEMANNLYIYLGPSLSSRTTAVGAHIPNPTAAAQVPSKVQVHVFDSHWNKSTTPGDPNYVDPAAAWANWYYPVNNPPGDSPALNASHTSTQSENPANYVGWTTVTANVVDSEAAPGNRDRLTTFAQLTQRELTTQAAVWQGHIWDNSIVGTWGVRKDIDRRWSNQKTGTASTPYPNFANPAATDSVRGLVNLSPNSTARGVPGYVLQADPDRRIQVTSHAWTVVGHLNQLPGISKWTKDLPVQISLFYNISTNFQPAGQRVDIYGDPLAAPTGKTIDRGILLESRDGKYSLKINKYETTALNASSSALNSSWFIGASQAWGGNWANRFGYDWNGDTIADAMPHNGPVGSEWMAGAWNYGAAPGETNEQAAAREDSAVKAWRTWQASVNPKFYKAWGINLNDQTHSLAANGPAGLTVTEDAKSTGYEVEFSAQPTRNWRITMNGSKQQSIRSNIGGTALGEFVAAYTKALNNGAPGSAGDLRIWWGGAGATTTLQQWNQTFLAEWNQRKLEEGNAVPELRKWHYNVISNYDFDHGWLKGVNAGAAVRYESSIIIGYKPLHGATANDVSFDLSSPYYGPAETNFDFWIGYRRRVWRNIDWNIQLNVRNAFVGNSLEPINAQPDGSAAMYRIRPPRNWELSNTFSF
jgi:hypothetical protein